MQFFEIRDNGSGKTLHNYVKTIIRYLLVHETKKLVKINVLCKKKTFSFLYRFISLHNFTNNIFLLLQYKPYYLFVQMTHLKITLHTLNSFAVKFGFYCVFKLKKSYLN